MNMLTPVCQISSRPLSAVSMDWSVPCNASRVRSTRSWKRAEAFHAMPPASASSTAATTQKPAKRSGERASRQAKPTATSA